MMERQGNIKAETHPAHYMMHKYWARKPHNVVRDYILNYTKPGELVLDPFMGSGVVPIEAVKHGRRAIGVDLNPVACFIAKNTLSHLNLEKFDKCFKEIYEKNFVKYSDLYQTKCPHCKHIATLDNSVWEEDSIVRLRGVCKKCGRFVKNADDFDREIFGRARKLFKELDSKKRLFYPKDKILQFVMRSKKTHLNQLFSERALLILGVMIKDIFKISDNNTKNLILMCFTSMLPNVSKMIPGDEKIVNGRSGWVISKLWAPKIHTEKNIFVSFRQRYEKIRKGKIEINDHIKDGNAKILNASCENLRKIESESIDYIFTDPPYGSSIAYFGLSMFWNAWLKERVDYDNEIIYDTYRKKGYEDYGNRMSQAFKEFFRVLKDKKYLSFTFHNRDLNIWKVIMDAVKDAGFHLNNVVYQEQAVSSGTQGINRKNTLRGDFVYNFYKDTSLKQRKKQPSINSKELIISHITQWIKNSDIGITSDALYEKLIPLIVENDAYVDKVGKVIDVESLIKTNFAYKKVMGNGKLLNVWQLRANESSGKSQYTLIDLFSGVGGISSGFRKAGYKIISANEYDLQIAKSYSRNHPTTKMIPKDIRKVGSAEFLVGEKEVDVIVGGPPCQGFSMAGRRIRNNGAFVSDPRNELFKEFQRIVRDLRPKVFVMENVDAILSSNNGEIAETIIKVFRDDLGYNTEVRVLRAVDYGVPQIRRRAVFIGNRLGIDSKEFFPDKTHGPETSKKYVTVGDAILDLPHINSGEGEFESSYDKPPREEYQIQRRNGTTKIYNHQAGRHDPNIIEILKRIKEGEGRESLPKNLQTKSVHSGAFGRMDRNKPAYTITTRFDTPSVGRVTHPFLHRSLTPREAARIQSFDDDIVFYGSKSSIGKQIGNAVPPLLAYTIAKKISDRLKEYDKGI